MIKLSHGPTQLTINRGNTFLVTDPGGEIDPRQGEGLFADDTRFLSRYLLSVNGRPWDRVSSAAISYDSARIYLQQPGLEADDISGLTSVAAGEIGLTIVRTAGEGIHETFELTNYGLDPAKILLELELGSDFADLMEVKSDSIHQRRDLHTSWSDLRSELSARYEHDGFRRGFIYQVANCQPRPAYANGRLAFAIELGPHSTWQACGHMLLQSGDRLRTPACPLAGEAGGEEEAQQLMRRWLDLCTGVETGCADLLLAYRQSVDDMAALRLYDSDIAPNAWVPAGGIPWFVTLFGRDSLIAALQNSIVEPGFAEGALRTLGEMQARQRDDRHDAQPGKILHEIRSGELAYRGLIPQTPYYGSWDSTSLYLIALAEAWRWTADRQLIEELRDTAIRCLDWIDRYGDLDGDGFQEYQTYSDAGYENQGWKDAHDAVVYADGSQVRQPKATCELQGYVYAAKRGMADVFRALGDDAHAERLEIEAADLKRRFNEAFWMPAEDFFAYGLDPAKEQIRSIASNPGHCLWSGIVDQDKAGPAIERLLRDDMWTGWGIRTLSSNHPAYNPLSYQRGSVWPHDNGIIALGMKRYGFHDQANRVARGLLEATAHFPNYRLPELFAGFPREPAMFPVRYREANVPQAWSAGAIFHLLQAMLDLRADAPRNRLSVNPTLPDFVPALTLSRLRVGSSRLTLRFHGTDFEVQHESGPAIEVLRPRTI